MSIFLKYCFSFFKLHLYGQNKNSKTPLKNLLKWNPDGSLYAIYQSNIRIRHLSSSIRCEFYVGSLSLFSELPMCKQSNAFLASCVFKKIPTGYSVVFPAFWLAHSFGFDTCLDCYSTSTPWMLNRNQAKCNLVKRKLIIRINLLP